MVVLSSFTCYILSQWWLGHSLVSFGIWALVRITHHWHASFLFYIQLELCILFSIPTVKCVFSKFCVFVERMALLVHCSPSLASPWPDEDPVKPLGNFWCLETGSSLARQALFVAKGFLGLIHLPPSSWVCITKLSAISVHYLWVFIVFLPLFFHVC